MSRLQSRTWTLDRSEPEDAPAPHAGSAPRSNAAETTPLPPAGPSASPPANELQKKLLEMIRRNEALRKAAPR